MTFLLCVIYIIIGVVGHILYLEYQERKLKQIISDTNKFVIPEGATHVNVHMTGGGGGGGGSGETRKVIYEPSDFKLPPPTFPGQMPRDLDHDLLDDEPCGECVLYGPNNCVKHFGG